MKPLSPSDLVDLEKQARTASKLAGGATTALIRMLRGVLADARAKTDRIAQLEAQVANLEKRLSGATE